MIPVRLAEEPVAFAALVREPGLDAIAELVGEPPSRPRSGGPRRVVAASRDTIPARAFPDLWTKALPELRERYHNLCAYLALHIHHATGNATVDHFVSKTKDWRRVYEWSNYRLCSLLINGHKTDRDIPLDPCSIEPGLYALELTEFQVMPGPAAQGATIEAVNETIEILGLNRPECRKARAAYIEDYRLGPPVGIGLVRLERHAPFVAHELRRQGMLVRGDV